MGPNKMIEKMFEVKSKTKRKQQAKCVTGWGEQMIKMFVCVVLSNHELEHEPTNNRHNKHATNGGEEKKRKPDQTKPNQIESKTGIKLKQDKQQMVAFPDPTGPIDAW